ncbi:MAG: hypothetical protein LBD08_05290 [Treponema sp.]|jgi:hypothetical protein|nr:hypothetical protein [Treponema sp.]
MGKRKAVLLLILSLAVTGAVFSQNMLILGGEYNPLSPGFWSVGAGFNLELFNEYIQDDLMFNFGGVTALNEQGERPPRFIFSIKDSVYFSLDWDWIGLRAGITASAGLYQHPEFPEKAALLFSAGGFAGLCVLPRSPISITVDLCPGYAAAFHVTDKPDAALDEPGFILPVALGIRLNLDKL